MSIFTQIKWFFVLPSPDRQNKAYRWGCKEKRRLAKIYVRTDECCGCSDNMVGTFGAIKAIEEMLKIILESQRYTIYEVNEAVNGLETLKEMQDEESKK